MLHSPNFTIIVGLSLVHFPFCVPTMAWSLLPICCFTFSRIGDTFINYGFLSILLVEEVSLLYFNLHIKNLKPTLSRFVILLKSLFYLKDFLYISHQTPTCRALDFLKNSTRLIEIIVSLWILRNLIL